jgi:hypothetical protein
MMQMFCSDRGILTFWLRWWMKNSAGAPLEESQEAWETQLRTMVTKMAAVSVGATASAEMDAKL